ncbi:hypothetical protein ABPG75_005813 [Micractinium tetrahymenae]
MRAQAIGAPAALAATPAAARRLCAARRVPAAGLAARRAVVVAALAGGVPVTFQVEKQAGPGEHVRVVGGPRPLGEWDIGRAPRLELVNPGSNLWSGTVEGLAVGQPFPFKFILTPEGAAASSDVMWESIPDRTFQPGGEQTIKAVWDQAGFEAGPAAPGTGGPSSGQAAGHGIDGQIKSRLEATLTRLSAEARSNGKK